MKCLVNPPIGKLREAVQSHASVRCRGHSARLLPFLTTSLLQNPTQSRTVCLQQLSYLIVCAKGMSAPEDDLVDLDSSFDDSPQLREIATQIGNDARIVEMRTNLGHAVEGVVSIWASDVEVVQVSLDLGHNLCEAN